MGFSAFVCSLFKAIPHDATRVFLECRCYVTLLSLQIRMEYRLPIRTNSGSPCSSPVPLSCTPRESFTFYSSVTPSYLCHTAAYAWDDLGTYLVGALQDLVQCHLLSEGFLDPSLQNYFSSHLHFPIAHLFKYHLF